MKPLFRCEYCDQIGTEEELLEHEATCIHNYSKKSCFTCKYVDKSKASTNNFSCNLDKAIPEGQYIANCDSYVWDEKDHTTRQFGRFGLFNNIFGKPFGGF